MKHLLIYIIILTSISGFSQKKLSKLLEKYNNENIPYTTVAELKENQSNIIFLDAREQKEYNTSHIKNAVFVGYDFFSLDALQNKSLKKDSKIVVYCSLGIRSEDIAEKLKKAGYTNVENLYGGIFEWKNNDLPVYNTNEKETDSVHAFSKGWGKWLKKGIKTYE